MLQLKKPKTLPARKIFPIQEKLHSPIWKNPAFNSCTALETVRTRESDSKI